MQSPIIHYIPFIFIGVMILMALIIVPTVYRYTRRKQKEAFNMLPNLARRMGLQAKSNGVVGNYKGYHIDITMGLSTNYAKAYSAISSVDASKMYGKQTFSSRLEVFLHSDTNSFPPLAFYQSMNWLRTHQKIQDIILEREPNLPKMDIDTQELKKIQVYGTNTFTAEKIINDPKVKKLLSNWIYPDIRMSGNQVHLLLDNNNLLNEMGKRLSNSDYIVQAADICVAVADAAKQN